MSVRKLVAGLGAGVALSLGASAALAQQADPTADAYAECVEGEGFIFVEIVDDFSATYDVVINGDIVDASVTDSDEDWYEYGPFDDGTYSVVVYWLTGGAADGSSIFSTELEIDCVPDVTTTVVETTVVETTVVDTTVVETTTTIIDTLPETGRDSTGVLMAALVLLVAGGALLMVRTSARSS